MPEHMIKKPNGDWFLDLRYKGERIRESTGTSDRRIAERILAQKKAEVEGGKYKASKVTFKELATKWLDEELPEKAKKSQPYYKHMVEKILIPYFKNKRVVDILDDSDGDSDIKVFLKLHSKKPQTTFNYYRDLLKWILGWNRPDFKIPNVKCKKARWRQTNFLTKDEMEKIVSSMSPKFQPIGWILAETGIDVSEAIDLKWSDFKNGILDLPRNKSGIPRKVYLSEKVKSILREKSRFRTLGEERIFPDINNRFGLRKSFARAVEKSGPGWNVRLKDLRHYFGSTHINAGVDSIIVAQMMGHADIGMIHRNYGHISNEGLENARQKVSVLGGQ